MSPKESERSEKFIKTNGKRLLGYIITNPPTAWRLRTSPARCFLPAYRRLQDIRRIENRRHGLQGSRQPHYRSFRKKRPVSISYYENAKKDEDGPLSLQKYSHHLGQDRKMRKSKKMIWDAIEETFLNCPMSKEAYLSQ